MEMSEPKTKSFVKQMDALGLGGQKVLVIEGMENVNLHLASRNRPEVKMLDASSVNAYEVLNHRWILISEQALQSLTEVLT
jgi:large subunit ribosomal protein L4